MAYTPTVWETGDIITAEKLNKAENGIAAAGPVMIPAEYNADTYTITLSASYDDLEALEGQLVCAYFTDATSAYRVMVLNALFERESTYHAEFLTLQWGESPHPATRVNFTASASNVNMTFLDD